MTVKITGKTFAHRELFKSMRGRWDGPTQAWYFEDLTNAQVMQLRFCVGCHVIDDRPRWLKDGGIPQPVIRNPYVEPRPTSTFYRSGKTEFVGDDPTNIGLFADRDPIAFFGFSSLAALADYVEALKRPDNTGGTCDIGWMTTEKRIKATATQDMAHALRLAREGWTEGLGASQMFEIPQAERKRRARVMAGGSVSVGRMLAGNPKHMIRRLPQPRNKRITVYVDCMMWRGIIAANAMLRAMLIGSCIDAAERQGYACEIYAVSSTISLYDRKAQSQLSVNVKAAGERLNLLDVMFALGHPALLRRFKFACEGVRPELGLTYEIPGLISECFNEHHKPGPNAYYFPQIPPHINQSQWSADPLSMLDHILPKDFPIEIQGCG